MYIIIGTLLTILVFGIIVFFHELGHFLFAKLFGVKVEEFGLGIPPRAKKLFSDKSGTTYSLNWLPIGGFVNLKGEKYEDNLVGESDVFFGKKIWQQMIVILAGVTFNFILAFVILSGLFYFGVEPLAINTKFPTQTKTLLIPDFETAIKSGIMEIDGINLEPVKGSVAEKSGIQKNDIVKMINGKQINTPEEVINMIKYIPGTLEFKIKRGKVIEYIKIIPIDGKIGSYVGYNANYNKNFKYQFGFTESINQGYNEVLNQTLFTYELLGGLIKNLTFPNTAYERKEAVESVGGPIALGKLFIKMIEENVGLKVIIVFGMLLSINIGAFNLLPFPALDGGRFFVLAVNGIIIFFFGKKAINERVENLIHVLGFFLLIGISILIAFKDVFQIFGK